MNASLSRREASSLSTIALICLGIIANSFHGDGEPLIVSGALSGIAFASTYSLIRWLGISFIRVGLKGRDMAKLKKVEMYVGSVFA
jgi:UDP-N-acetylglucosamine--dolichyl-phosphate N-acetylglucosaminephosphotransferase